MSCNYKLYRYIQIYTVVVVITLQDTVTFSDDDDALDLGIDDAPVKPKTKAVDRSDGGMKDSLFGKSNSVEKHLQRPGTGGSQREFNIPEQKGAAALGSSGL